MPSTTELLVEHIISGILSLIWIIGFALCFTGIDVSLAPLINEYWGLFAVISTAVAYPIGILVDTIADKILEPWNRSIKSNYYADPKINILQLIKQLKDGNITNYFTYNRFKLRVARSSALNFLMIGVSLPAFLLVNGGNIGIEMPNSLIIVIFLIFALLSIALVFLWREIANTIHSRTITLWEDNNLGKDRSNPEKQ